MTRSHTLSNVFRLAIASTFSLCIGKTEAQTFAGSGLSGASFVPPAHASCSVWQGSPNSIDNQATLQLAINSNQCVEIAAGTHLISKSVVVGNGKTVRGVGGQSVLKADPLLWTFENLADANGNEGVLNILDMTQSGPPAATGARVSNLKIDASGVSTYGVVPTGLLDNLIIVHSRCSGVGITAPGASLTNSLISSTARETIVVKNGVSYLHNCRGKYVQKSHFPGQTCVAPKEPGNPNYCLVHVWANAVDEGAAIYLESPTRAANYPVPTRLGAVIRNNVVTNTYGPALDVNGVWDGIFQFNTVSGGASWAAVSLYGASNWIITNNHISHPINQPGHPYHPKCRNTPPSQAGNSAAVFLCQDTDINNLITQNNLISQNRLSSYIGILSVGDTDLGGYMVPRMNLVTLNDPFGSVIGCLDKVPSGMWSSQANTWIGNFCSGPGVASTPITY
jgi:hypothetical protein